MKSWPRTELSTLSGDHARSAAISLLGRCGEIAIALAVLRAQEAELRGRYGEMTSWSRIAEAAVALGATVCRPSPVLRSGRLPDRVAR